MSSRILLSLLFLFTLWPRLSNAQKVYQQEGNIFFEKSAGVALQLTFAGLDLESTLSPDGRWVVFVRDTPNKLIGIDHATELRIISSEGKGERLLVKGGISSGPNKALAALKSPQFFADNRRVAFHSAWAAVHGSVHIVDVHTGRVKYVGPGNSVEVIQSGEYRNHLIVTQHKYFLVGGTYDWYWLTTSDGKEVDPIGEEENLSMFKEMYLDGNK